MNRKLDLMKNLLWSLIWTILVIGLCLTFNRDFFNTDDAFNEMLGFYTQYGRIWSSGNIPLIVDTMFVGGNGIIDLGKGIFLPQTILGSLLTYHININITGIFLASFNIFLMTYSGIVIAKHFNISKAYAYGFATCLAIQPVFLYQYSAGWWNAANGQAWAMVAIATFLVLKNKFSITHILLNIASVVCLLGAGWPHGVIGYAIFTFLVLAFDLYHKENIVSLILLALPSAIALLFALPIYSEYLISSELISRPSDFNNYGDFLVPSWASILMGFNPSYYDFIHYFGGYRIMLVPLAFSTMLLPFVIFYRKSLTHLKSDFSAWLIVAIIIVYFIFTQMPSQFGSLRWSFRFLPFLSFAICLIVFYLLDKAESKKITLGYVILILCSFLLSLSKSIGENTDYILLQIITGLFLILIPYFTYRATACKFAIISISSLAIMLVGLKSLGGIYVPFEKLPQTLANVNNNKDGFLLSFTNTHGKNNSLNELNSAHFGVYHIKSINGYSPVGNIKLEQLLPHPSAHGIFNIDIGLPNVLRKSQYNDICIANLMKVSSISLPKSKLAEFRDKLTACGYTDIIEVSNDDVFASLPQDRTINWERLPPAIFPQNVRSEMIQHTNNTDKIELGIRTEETTLIFPRVWWHGYQANFNGNKLPVISDETGVLVKVVVPSGEAGTLTLNYFPKTWKKIWFIPLLGFILLGFLFFTRKHYKE